jgi:uncharacterized protein YbaR (Trm112 family)
MKESLLPILACPHCYGDLNLHDEITDNTEIIEGILQCSACDRTFIIEAGVPNLLYQTEADITQRGFMDQWELRSEGKFENKLVFGLRPEKRAEFMRAQMVEPVQPDEWLLDLGCGSAEITYALAAQHPEAQVVGFDYSSTLQQSARNAFNVPNLHFVRGDAMRPPFKPFVFMKLFAIGVLHHSSNTAEAFQATAALVARGGRMMIWLYPDPLENPLMIPYYSIRDLNFLGQGHRLPTRWRARLAKLQALPLLPSFALTYNLLQKAETLFKGEAEAGLVAMSPTELHQSLSFILLDNISPEYQFRHKKQEVMSWFKAEGFVEAVTNHFGLYSGKRQ